MDPRLAQMRAVLPSYRWFRRKDAGIANLRILDQAALGGFSWVLLECTYTDGAQDRYSVGFQGLEPSETEWVGGFLCGLDAHGRIATAGGGTIKAKWAMPLPESARQTPRSLAGEMSNTLALLGSSVAAKILRTPLAGVNPEIEMLEHLSQAGFPHIPHFLGHAGYFDPAGERFELILFMEFVSGAQDLWKVFQKQLLNRCYDQSLSTVRRIGEVLAQLHRLLATADGDSFRPEPVDNAFIGHWLSRMGGSMEEAARAASAETVEKLNRVFNHISRNAPRFLNRAMRIRQHGDFHLGQILTSSNNSLFIIDFEGEVLASPQERRQKHLPLKDAAGLLRSLHYAAHAVQRQTGTRDDLLRKWYGEARTAFLDSYLPPSASHGLLPCDPLPLLAALEFEKALYELQYEIQNRPDWVSIPIEGISEIASFLLHE